MNIPRFLLFWTFLCLTSAIPHFTQAHSLGIDPAELTEQTSGQYTLNAQVPVQLQTAIATPILPEKCGFSEGSTGIASPSGIRFDFGCQPRLNADDIILLPWAREGVLLTVTWADGSAATHLVARSGEAMNVALIDFSAGSSGFIVAAQRYTVLGVEHILLGIDHLLFVLALMMMVGGGWRLVKTITAFTVAHSLTLAAATLGYLSVPAAPVEATIALSIVFICSEIVHASRGRRGLTYAFPWVVSFSFGLLHGLGFAGALSEIGLPQSEIPTALLFFNIGVELGQLLFVAVIFAGITAIKRSKIGILQTHTLLPAYAIGIIATFWFLQRAAMIFS